MQTQGGLLKRMQAFLQIRRPFLLFRSRLRFQGVPQEAINAVAQSAWARNLASAQARLLGFEPGSPAFNDAVNRGAINLAIRFLSGVSIPGAPSPPPPVRGRKP